MSDIDEDSILPIVNNTGENELEDETQDFRFLASFSSSSVKIPKRGEKDFESHGTLHQTSVLEASRTAMHEVLSQQRIHNPRTHVIGTYVPERNMAYVLQEKGNVFRTIGTRSGDRTWLLPEEALYLVERGTLDCRWPFEQSISPDTNDEDVEGESKGVGTEGDQSESGIPMSLQGAYAAFIGTEINVGGKLTLERYAVYSNLKRLGYHVLRASTFDGPLIPPPPASSLTNWRWPWLWNLGPFHDLWDRLFTPRRFKQGPLVTYGLYRDWASVYRMLHLIPRHDPRSVPIPPSQKPHSNTLDDPYHIHYHVHKPAPAFRKSSPGPPDFQICVIDARATPFPSLAQLEGLLAAAPLQEPKGTLYFKLKQGWRNVLLAVVDNGIVSFMRVSEAGFGEERVFKSIGRGRGGKRGRGERGRGSRGGRGGRGRGNNGG
ncbi:hypothetical protein M501DRAFT_928062 [Patellaria atrata CBS 101060]|uniref:tRNA-splicing endonuclease subunit Sen54 N-terminal domain-containing protein n=1 Tax=Patellaria atrata CBS 101060 TaxID=1346257 RepID=A0A9P4VSN4_9PEZI|nr:hypothetical protein M501DRAFT_928062 [Patellaria atrata CBS 101060]